MKLKSQTWAFCAPSPPYADCGDETCRAPKDQFAAASGARHSRGAALWGSSGPSTLTWSLGPAKRLPWAHERLTENERAASAPAAVYRGLGVRRSH